MKGIYWTGGASIVIWLLQCGASLTRISAGKFEAAVQLTGRLALAQFSVALLTVFLLMLFHANRRNYGENPKH